MIATKYRIEKNSIYHILKKGELFTSKLFIIRYIKNNKKFHRFRTIISKKFEKKAVDRNKTRRRIYEAVRMEISELPSPNNNEYLDIILIPKKRIQSTKFDTIRDDIRAFITQHG